MTNTNTLTPTEAAVHRIANATEQASDWLNDDGTIAPDMPQALKEELVQAYMAAPPEFWQQWQQAAPHEAQEMREWAAATLQVFAMHRVTQALTAAQAYPEGQHPPEVLDELADALQAAPESYQQDPAMTEWMQWADNHQQRRQDAQERRDFPRFFELLDIIETKGEAAANDPACNDLFVELVHCAPPRYREKVRELLSDALPQATHCDDEGQPVYSVAQLAEHFGKTPEEVTADIERLQAKGLMRGNLYTGPVHPLQ